MGEREWWNAQPEEILGADCLTEYHGHIKGLQRELQLVHANFAVLKLIRGLPWKALYIAPAPQTAWGLIAENLLSVVVVSLYKLARDLPPRGRKIGKERIRNLNRLSFWVADQLCAITKEKFHREFRACWNSKDWSDELGRLKEVRHSRTHLKELAISATGAQGATVEIAELEGLAQAITKGHKFLCFGFGRPVAFNGDLSCIENAINRIGMDCYLVNEEEESKKCPGGEDLWAEEKARLSPETKKAIDKFRSMKCLWPLFR